MNFRIQLYHYRELTLVAQQMAANYLPVHDPDICLDEVWLTSEGKPVDADIIDAGQLCDAPSVIEVEKEHALAQVFEYLLHSEQQHFVTSPDENHIYFQLLVAKHGLKQAQAMVKQLCQ